MERWFHGLVFYWKQTRPTIESAIKWCLRQQRTCDEVANQSKVRRDDKKQTNQQHFGTRPPALGLGRVIRYTKSVIQCHDYYPKIDNEHAPADRERVETRMGLNKFSKIAKLRCRTNFLQSRYFVFPKHYEISPTLILKVYSAITRIRR